MRTIFICIITALLVSPTWAQQNCEAFKLAGDSTRYQACLATNEAAGHYQFSRQFHEAMEEAIRIDPTYDYPYSARSVAYLKAGNFLEWKKLIDQAVVLNPAHHLGYRAWCRYQFFNDYEGAIADIERLEQLINYDIGHGANGDYHLTVTKAICYKMLGHIDKAIDIIESHMQRDDYWTGIYDYLHLGVLYLEKGLYDQALNAFEKQTEENEKAENLYYKALTLRKIGDEDRFIQTMRKAKEAYRSGRVLFDGYTEIADKIYLSDIEDALRKSN